MRVAAIDANGDWTFGRGLSGYRRGTDAVRQMVQTRLREFVNDWFLDTTAGIDWIRLCSARDSQAEILREVRRVVLTTEGVLTLDFLSVELNRQTRALSISLRAGTIYDTEIQAQLAVVI